MTTAGILGPYSAIIYNDGTNIKAMTGAGLVLPSGVLGVNDSAVANAAVQACPNGGLVKIMGGSYDFTPPLLLNVPGTQFEGEVNENTLWYNTTRVKTSSSNAAVIISAANCTVKNIRFNNCYNGVNVIPSDDYLVASNIEHCAFSNIAHKAVYYNAASHVLDGPHRVHKCAFLKDTTDAESFIELNVANGGDITDFDITGNLFEDAADYYVKVVNNGLVEMGEISGNYSEDYGGTSVNRFFYLYQNDPTAVFYGRKAMTGNEVYITNPASYHTDINIIAGSCQMFPVIGNWFPNAIHNFNVGAAADIQDIKYIGNDIYGKMTFQGNVGPIMLNNNVLGGSLTFNNVGDVKINDNFHESINITASGYNTLSIQDNQPIGASTLTISISGGLSKPIIKNNPRFPMEAGGSRTGTGSSESFAHGCKVPTGLRLKATVTPTATGANATSVWADGTNFHCAVTSGKKYDWNFEAV